MRHVRYFLALIKIDETMSLPLCLNDLLAVLRTLTKVKTTALIEAKAALRSKGVNQWRAYVERSLSYSLVL
jgi:hypothetical protein